MCDKISHVTKTSRGYVAVDQLWFGMALANPSSLTPSLYVIPCFCGMRRLSHTQAPYWRDSGVVVEMAEQHDVKAILQLARKYVADVQDMVYGK